MGSTLKKNKGMIKPKSGSTVSSESGENGWCQVRAQSVKEKLYQTLVKNGKEDFSEDH